MRRSLRAFIARRVEPDLVDDLVQDVLARILEHLPGLRDPGSLQAWMFSIARRAVIDVYRRRDRQDLPLDFDPSGDGVSDPGVLHELGACVLPMLGTLPEPYRRTLMLADLEGLRHADIARREGIGLAGVRSRLGRGRDMLKRRFEDCCRLHRNQAGQIVDYSAQAGCGCQTDATAEAKSSDQQDCATT